LLRQLIDHKEFSVLLIQTLTCNSYFYQWNPGLSQHGNIHIFSTGVSADIFLYLYHFFTALVIYYRSCVWTKCL